MRVYISGKITGTADYLSRFDSAEKYLEQQGYSVVNPAWINFQMPRDTTHEQYMTVSLALLSTCDKMYMLRGWETSKGANMERDYAIRNEIPVEFER